MVALVQGAQKGKSIASLTQDIVTFPGGPCLDNEEAFLVDPDGAIVSRPGDGQVVPLVQGVQEGGGAEVQGVVARLLLVVGLLGQPLRAGQHAVSLGIAKVMQICA